MQIKCSKDVSGWFDELSILENKLLSTEDIDRKRKICNQLKLLYTEINDGIGMNLSIQIYNSPEYKELYRLNKNIFDSIDKLRKLESLVEIARFGKQIDTFNTKRYVAKNNLQKKYFNTEVKEVKIS